MKRWILAVGLTLIVLGTVACGRSTAHVAVPKAAPTAMVPSTSYGRDSTQRQRLVRFTQAKMVRKQGVYTNYRDTQQRQASAATGHEMLSESSGMWLLYLAEAHRWRDFREFYGVTKRTFYKDGQFSYRYDPRSGKRYGVNATLDDLRIIRALLAYDQLRGTHHYRRTAATLYAHLRTGALGKGEVTNYYDPAAKSGTRTASLAYFDLQVLRYYSRENATTRRQYARQLRVVKGGYLGDAFPLYAADYNWQTGKYGHQNLNTTEAMETLLHLAQVGQLRATTRRWLVQRVNRGDLALSYSTAGEVVNAGQSAGSYAVCAQIFRVLHDREHYQAAMRRVWADQVTKPQSPLFGGIGDATTQDAFSYNNLAALVAAFQ